MFRDDEERQLALRSVEALLTLVREYVIASGEVQLYSVWDGNEGLAPKGAIDVALDSLRRETFFLNEQFLVSRRLRARRSAHARSASDRVTAP